MPGNKGPAHRRAARRLKKLGCDTKERKRRGRFADAICSNKPVEIVCETGQGPCKVLYFKSWTSWLRWKLKRS